MSEGIEAIKQRVRAGRLKVWPTDARDHFKFSWPPGKPRRDPSDAEKIDQAIDREVLRLLPWHKDAP